MRRSILLFLVVGLFSGCAHNITLMARESTEMGTGVAAATLGNSGTLEIQIRDDLYKGKWVYASGGSIGLLNTYGANPSTGTVVGVSGSGVGNALLRSESGKSLRCEFNYSEWTSTGTGICQDGEGRLYDMQID